MNDVSKRQLITVAILLSILPLFLLILQLRQRILPKAFAPKAEVILDPATVTSGVDDDIPISIVLSTQAPISAVHMVFSYKSNVVNIAQVKPNLAFFTDDLTPQLTATAGGSVALTMVSRKPITALASGKVKIGEIILHGVGPGTSPFTVSSESQVVGPGENGNASAFELYQVQEPSITIQAGIVDPPKIAFSLRAYGITGKGAKMTVVLRAVDTGNGAKKDFSMPLTSDDRGVYKTDGFFTLSGLKAKRTYTLFIKGPKHVARKMEESKFLHPGDNAENRLDWVSKPLQPGDVPISGVQDGKVDALDASMILGLLDLCDSTSAGIADLNLDGCVNLNDYSLYLATVANGSTEDEK